MNQIAHQIRYCWSPASLLGTRGMGPVESTLPADVLATWDRYLRDHVWAAGTRPGFTFVVRDGVGALLRKVATAAEDGRPGSAAHALLSPELKAADALGLTSWDGWDAPALSVLPWSALAPAADRGLSELRARARALPADRLAALFAQVLHAPGEGFTVIGEPDPLAVTCALGDLIGETPTFASDEASDTGPHLPTAVFLREASFSSTTATRRRIAPAAPLADPALSSFAVAAVDAYAADGMDGIALTRRAKPPADLVETREWVSAAQFAPGVLADVGRLPRLSPTAWQSLAREDALQRVAAAAAAASPAVLARALDERLPEYLLAVIVPAAVAAASGTPGDPALLERLAQFGPIPLDLVAGSLPADVDQLARITHVLLTPRDRRIVLEQAARDLPLTGLIDWIDRQAPADPAGALAMYSALCARAGRASQEDVEALVSRGGLAGAVRQFSESGQQSSIHLVTLLRALPRGALDPDAVAGLAAHVDPVLLHALDTIVTDPSARADIHYQVRLAYYQEHLLHEPTALLPGDGPPGDGSAEPQAPRRRWHGIRRHQPHHNHGKPT
jgi:hypothetical protein